MKQKLFKNAVVIGKFYPPHVGHNYLIETALSQSQTVHVLVCHKAIQQIPGWLRVKWLQELHPSARVLGVEDTLGDDDTQAWARFTIEFLGFAPDAVFSSEEYGQPFATMMGSRHVSVDMARRQIPCSATMIRTKPLENLRFLSPLVRQWFVPRICLVGAESSGKTSLAQALAAHFNILWMPEYAREYCALKYGPQPFANGASTDTSIWESQEFLNIANEHARREDGLAGESTAQLIVDTDAFATGIWHERYLNQRSLELYDLAEQRRVFYALYILCGTEIPWQQDGTRDGAAIREQMQDRFRQELIATRRPWIEAKGPLEARLTTCIQAIEHAMANWHPFNLHS